MGMQAPPLLRPLQFGELLDRAFRLYRGNFLTFIGILAAAYVPLMLIPLATSVILRSSIFDIFSRQQESIIRGIVFLFVLAQYILMQGIATSALTRAVADNYLGRKTGILIAYRDSSPAWFTLTGALLFLGIVVVGLVFWWMVPLIGWFTGLGMVLFVTTVVNHLLPSAVIMEHQGVISAIKRAWSLARRRFWQVMGYALILLLFGTIVQMGVTLIVGTVVSLLSDEYFFQIFQGAISLLFMIIYYPLQMVAFTLIYFDLRVRTEGLDLALLTLGVSDPADVSRAMTSIPQVQERLFTWSELGYFAILTPIGVIFYIFFYPMTMGSFSFFAPFLFY
jgi:hypothetical protein